MTINDYSDAKIMDFCLSFDQMLLNHLVKKFVDIVNLTENFDNFGVVTIKLTSFN